MRSLLLSMIALLQAGNMLFAQEAVDLDNYNIEHSSNQFSIPGYLYLGLAGGLPDLTLQQSIKSDYGDITLGFASGFGINPFGKKRESPLLLGIDFSYLTFGRDKITDPFTSFRYKFTINKIFVGPSARIYFPLKGKIALFADGMVGGHIMNGRIKVDKTIFDDGEEDIVIGSENDGSLGYGFGLGIHSRKVRLVETDLPEAHASFFVRLSYLSGDRSRFIKRGSVQVTNDVLSYQTGFTSTGMIQLTIGAIIY